MEVLVYYLNGNVNRAKEFASGAALRSVTDWAHYNHGYTGRSKCVQNWIPFILRIIFKEIY
jgi:hypothetical protein